MTDLLEHIQNPIEILKYSYKILKCPTGGGGILCSLFLIQILLLIIL
ncbi:hypothetical protein [Brachyspira hampsonii]